MDDNVVNINRAAFQYDYYMSPLRKPLILEVKQNGCDTLLKNLTNFVHSDIEYCPNSTELNVFCDILICKIFTNTFRSGLLY